MIDLRPFQNILILRTSALGDIVHALPFLSSLKKAYPEKKFFWLAKSPYAPLLEDNPYLEGFIPFTSFLNIGRLARGKRWEVCFDLQGLWRSAVIPLILRIPHRWGWSNPREKVDFLYTATFKSSSPHIVDRYLSWAETLGGERVAEFPLPESDTYRKKAKEFFGSSQRRVVLVVGGGWETKRWGEEKFSRLARSLKRAKYSVFILWGPGEGEIKERIREKAGGEVTPFPLLGIRGMVEFLREADLVVGGDTGPLHIASALGKKIVGIYGPTDPLRNGPYTREREVVTPSLECVPCWKRKCPRKNLACMEEIEVRKVREAVERLMDS